MKKRFISICMAGVLGVCIMTGCQKAPDASADSDVYHAKSSLESEVEDIAAGKTEADTARTGGTEPGETYDGLVGTEENGIWISAQIPATPQTMPVLTLQKRDDLDEEKLKAVLASESGNVQDITEKYLEEREKESSEMKEDEKPKEFPHFGDDSLIILSDGSKEAVFGWGTYVSYVEDTLKENCGAIYKTAPELDVTREGESPSARFSLARAEEILQDKLQILDLTEICPRQVYYYELDGTAFYEITFSPVYEGISVAGEFGSVSYGEVVPMGRAWIAEGGIASLELGMDGGYCGKIMDRSEKGKILSFSQVLDILEAYLESGTLLGHAPVKLTQVELVYYAALQESELILTPAWHIYIPLKEVMESLDSGDEAWQTAMGMGAVHNIYLDAVTGELIKVE